MTATDFVEYAGFGRRTVAAFIDFILISFVTSIFHVLFYGGQGLQIIIENGNVALESDNSNFEFLLTMAFTVFMWTRFMGTPGKLLLGCHVVDIKTGKHVTVVQAIIRYLGYIVSFLPLALGFFWILWDPRKQGFHDKLAKTVVVLESHHTEEDESRKTLQQLMEECR